MIIEQLRSNTKATHEALESTMLPLIKGIKTIEDYVKLLHIFFGFYKPLQDQIDAVIDMKRMPEYKTFRRAEWILDDLDALGFTAQHLPVCSLDFSISSAEDIMGALYVTEGSTLGGKVICKMIAASLQKNDTGGLRFFNAYGNETGSHWKNFLAKLDTFSNTNGQQAIIDTAKNTFAGFQKWICEKVVP